MQNSKERREPLKWGEWTCLYEISISAESLKMMGLHPCKGKEWEAFSWRK